MRTRRGALTRIRRCNTVKILDYDSRISIYIRALLKTYQDRDEYNFDFEQGDSVHRRAGSPSCADQRSSEPKVFRFDRLAACCALAALRSPRQGFQPNRWRESLACITANLQSRHMGGFQRCPLKNIHKGTSEYLTWSRRNQFWFWARRLLLTGGPEALRARINMHQNQKCYRSDSLAACYVQAARLSPRQGFQPNCWR